MMKTETTNQAKINDWRWQIVQSKITDFDGLFFTAVRSTGIYCKPSCRSRLPKRENITFYPTQVEAERAGFRACLRCKPNLENTISPTAAMLVRARRFKRRVKHQPVAFAAHFQIGFGRVAQRICRRKAAGEF
jgi:methylphosphotriester-DNA--protein-cysteine methyltransferase